MAGTFNSLFTAELVRDEEPRHGIDDLEIAVTEYTDCFDMRCLPDEMGMIAPAETETRRKA